MDERITERQASAIDALLLGATLTDVARAVGVTRQTISRWANHDINFIAERNRRVMAREERVWALLDRVLIETLVRLLQTLESSSVRDLTKILDLLVRHGAPMRQSHGPTSPGAVANSLAMTILQGVESSALVPDDLLFAVEDLSVEAGDHPAVSATPTI